MKELTQALKRLEKSTTALTRKRSRRALRSAVNAILKKFPPIDRDGQEVKSTGAVCTCPLCRAPMATWKAFVKHLWNRHWRGVPVGARVSGSGNDDRCPGCHKTFSKLENHLKGIKRAGLDRFREHIVAGASLATFGKPGA